MEGTPIKRAWELTREAFHAPKSAIYPKVQSVVWALIVLSIALFGVELALEDQVPAWLDALDQVVLGLFIIEITLRIATFRPRDLDLFELTPTQRIWKHISGRVVYCLQPLVMVDILTVLALVPVLRGLRALRLLRLLRTAKFFKYSSPMQGIVRAFQENGLLFVFAFVCLGILVLVGGISVYLVEKGANANVKSLADGFWWALVTLTTVGFGDISPVTPMGRTVGSVLMIAGMFMLALFAGIVGSSLLNVILTLRQEQFRMRTDIDHIVICGYNQGARMLLDELDKEAPIAEREIMIMADQDRPMEVPARFSWTRGDPTKEAELDKVRLTHAAAVIIVAARHMAPQQADAVTLMTTFTIRSYMRRNQANFPRSKPLYIAAEVLESENVQHAKVAGADEVIETTRLGFSMIAHTIAMPGTAAVISRVVSSGAHSLYVAPATHAEPMPFAEVAHQIKREHGALLIGIRDPRNGIERINPPDDHPVRPQDHLLYLATEAVLDPDH